MNASTREFDRLVNGSDVAIEHRILRLPEGWVKAEPIGIEDEEDQVEDFLGLAEVIDLTGDDLVPRREAPYLHRRNPPVLSILPHPHNGMILRKGNLVEIKMIQGLHKVQFLEITAIYKTGIDVTVRGIPYTRAKYLRGQLPRLLNEVCMILQIDGDDERTDEDQAQVEVPIWDVIKKRDFARTNADLPQHRWPEDVFTSKDDIEERALLTCRWKYRQVWRTGIDRMKRTDSNRGHAPTEFSFIHLRASETSRARYEVDDTKRVNRWRGDKVRGGSHQPGAHQAEPMDIDVDSEKEAQKELESIKLSRGQKYTFGDMFCGAGGTSCGARQAGFQVKLGCDIDKAACQTFRVNYPEARLLEMNVFDLITNDDFPHYRVDVLHLSPPCQFWSPAHTISGKNDDANIAVLFSSHELIRKFRPRIFTLEQTFGILDKRFSQFFNSLMQGFTTHGYSVRWKVVHLWNWGLPAKRLRLVMLGACPGEELPPMPRHTHTETPIVGDGTRPFVTIQQALSRIPANAVIDDPLHKPDQMNRIYESPWDPNRPLQRTITCSGGVGNYHYSGTRNFTNREYATLQGFPVNYSFHARGAKKQIGNAFPPCVTKMLFRHLRRWLEKMDGVQRDDAAEVIEDDDDNDAVSGVQYIEINDDDDDLDHQSATGSSRERASRSETIAPEPMDVHPADEENMLKHNGHDLIVID